MQVKPETHSNRHASVTSSVMPAERFATTPAAAWAPPTVDGPRASRRPRPTLDELGSIERHAWDEAYAKGHAAGVLAGEQEAARRIDALAQRGRQFESILQTLVEPLSQLDDEIEAQLVNLSLAIARHLVRRELRSDPSQVIAVVRETVALLPLTQRNVRVHLHPLDAAVVRECLAEPQAERAWSIVEDPVMSRGGCRVSTDTAQIDARLETRIAAMLNHLLGEERAVESRLDATIRDDQGMPQS
jgi:flagellar assembly protein FliH